MKITKELIEKVSNTAKLNLSDVEIEIFMRDFEEILTNFSILDEIDALDEKRAFRPIDEENELREDVIKPSLSNEDALIFTKNKEDGFFIGPKTIN